MNKLVVKSIFAVIVMAVMATLNAEARKEKNEPVIQIVPKSVYDFNYATSPTGFTIYSVVTYPWFDHSVTTTQGFLLANVKDLLGDVTFSPAGNRFITLEKDKKGRRAAYVWDARQADQRVHKFDKKLGAPRSFVYTPTSRSVVLATDSAIYELETKKFTEIRKIKSSILPDHLVLSKNSYFLAVYNANDLDVVNFEKGESRRLFHYDETINSVFFSDDASMMGVLTADGILEIYDTANFSLKKTIDELGEGLCGAFNFDGKYVAVAVSPYSIEVVNILRDNERDIIDIEDGGFKQLAFLPDHSGNTILSYARKNGMTLRRMYALEPYYGRLIAEEVSERMNEWLQMMPGETLEQYKERVNDKTRAEQQRLFEEEITSRYAPDLLADSKMSFGKYDRANSMLEIDFDNMPMILLPVPVEDVTAFTNPGDLTFTDARYGIMPNDNFELIYAKIHNAANGNDYIFDNLSRRPLTFMNDDDNVVPLEFIQEQQMQIMRLEQLRQEMIAQAKTQNLISDHTHITVDSHIIPDVDADGNRILNYSVDFTYEVEPEYSAVEDFLPGKYHISESGAAQAMLSIVAKALNEDLAQYVKAGKKAVVKIQGTADATPIARTIKYDGTFGDFEEEPITANGQLTTVTVTEAEGVQENEQLAFLRAIAVRDNLIQNVPGINDMLSDYYYVIDISEERGSAFRRISLNITFIDAIR